MNITRRTFLKTALGTVGIFSLLGSYSYFLEPNWMETRTLTIRLPRLPVAFRGFRIAQFSDLYMGFHFDPEDLDDIVHEINRLKPDLICFTGDLVDGDPFPVKKAIPYLSKLKAPYGKFAVLGNHDYFWPDLVQLQAIWEESQFTLLNNQGYIIKKEESILNIAGVDDQLKGNPDLNRALRKLPNDTCTILLSHAPDFADTIDTQTIDLQLSGHSHGGQIRLPFIGPLTTPAYGKIYVEGLHQTKNEFTQIYVNRGLGTTILPFRFSCRPEISLLILDSESN